MRVVADSTEVDRISTLLVDEMSHLLRLLVGGETKTLVFIEVAAHESCTSAEVYPRQFYNPYVRTGTDSVLRN